MTPAAIEAANSHARPSIQCTVAAIPVAGRLAAYRTVVVSPHLMVNAAFHLLAHEVPQILLFAHANSFRFFLTLISALFHALMPSVIVLAIGPE